jgi:predicted metal-binding membrane protein
MVSEESPQLTAHIAQELRDAGLSCGIVNLVPTEPTVLRRDRILVGLGLILLTALAWSYVLRLSVGMDMGGMDMAGFRIIPASTGLMIPAHTPWGVMEFAMAFVMWTVMMVGMMIPSAGPMILMYARLGRQTEPQSAPLAATVWFVAGYFLAWAAFSIVATLVQWAAERAALLDSTMATTSNFFGGLVFVAAGSYQWTRLKDVCLTQCQKPFAFLMRHGGFRRDAPGALMLGLRHGVYCVGCCWALMALLLVGGAMNVLWIVLLTLLILLEKVTPLGRLIAPLAGTILIAAGAWFLSMGMS